MSAVLRHTVRIPSAVTATSAAASYPASNLLVPSVRRAWRSTGTGAQNIDLTIPSTASPWLCVQDCNATQIEVRYGASILVGTFATAQDRHGRRRLSVQIPATATALRLTLSGTPTDGAGFWQMGAVYVFASSLSLPDNPLLGSEANPSWPQTRVDLPNGERVVIDRGTPRQQLNLRFRTPRTADIDALVRLARAGICWLDLGVTANRELQWPVRFDSDTSTRAFATAAQDEQAIPLREVA